jgi:hypothetical protein
MRHHISTSRSLVSLIVFVLATSAVVLIGADGRTRGESQNFSFQPETLVVSRTVYAGTASTVTPGELLPPGCVASNANVLLLNGTIAKDKVTCGVAIENGEYPNLDDSHNVWTNDGSLADGSFAVSSPVFLDNINSDGDLLGTLPPASNSSSWARRRPQRLRSST